MKKFLFLILILFCFNLYSSDKVMDREGTVYQISQIIVNENPVLQLYIYFNDGIKTFITVPGTEDGAIENFPNLFYSFNTSNLFILYSKERENGSDLYLKVMHKDFTFSESYILSEGNSSYCINPKIYQTYKIIQNEDETKSILQLLHIIWWEKGQNDGAFYANIPIIFSNLDINAKTIIHLSDLISLEPKTIENEISPFLYEYPEIFIPKANENKLTLFFADLSSLSYIVLDFNYDGEDTLRDRAHFPDIGVRMPYPIPTNLTLETNPEIILGAEGRIALLMKGMETFDFSYFCNGWSSSTKIANVKDIYEAKNFVKRIIEDPIF